VVDLVLGFVMAGLAPLVLAKTPRAASASFVIASAPLNET
jgi:hypothetical protein